MKTKIKILLLFIMVALTFLDVGQNKVQACTPGVCTTTASGSAACGDFYPLNWPDCLAGVILCRNDFCDDEGQ